MKSERKDLEFLRNKFRPNTALPCGMLRDVKRTPEGRIAFNAGRIAGEFRWVLVDPGGSDEIELTQLTMAGATNTIDWLP